jgi:hypothetical protein
LFELCVDGWETAPGAPEPAITRIDFALDINVSDITAPIMLATPIYWSARCGTIRCGPTAAA